jgi:hypothetical protein
MFAKALPDADTLTNIGLPVVFEYVTAKDLDPATSTQD